MITDPRFEGYTSYIMTSYVDFVLSAGARVVPLIVNEGEESSLKKLNKLDAVLMPGGDGDYQDYGEFLYKKIVEFNDNGIFYPLYGICMGYENMVGY